MKYLRLVWSGLWRNRGRTILTLLAIVAAFLLFGILQGVDTSLKLLTSTGRLNVLVTTNPAGGSLPLADLPQIQAVKGVTAVSYESVLVGTYQTPLNLTLVLALDPDSFPKVFEPQFHVAPADLAALKRTRTGALITAELAAKRHWKIGDHIPIHALNAPKKDGTSDWTFDIVGYFSMQPSTGQPIMIAGYPYYDAARAADTGTVQLYVETIADASQAPVISNAIDNLFANSPNRTRTQTQRETAQSAVAQLGDLDFFVDAIDAAAFATLLLLIGTTLMQSYRERIGELAVMKTLGFSDQGVAVLILAEAVLLCVAAAALGLLVANAALGSLAGTLGGVLPALHVPRIVFLTGILGAVALALVSAGVPAWQANRLSIVQALAVR